MEKTIHIQELDIHYKHYPNEGSEKIIILHGWGGKSDSWVLVAEQLQKAGFEVIVPDLPFFGKSEHPKKAWTVESFAHFVEDFVEKTGFQNAICIAHSHGGRTIFKLHDIGKDLFSKYILVGAAGIKHPPTLKQKVLRGVAKTIGPIFTLPGVKTLHHFARKVLYKIAGSYDYMETSGAMKETFLNVIDENLENAIPKITKPTLLVWGDDDSYVPLSDGKKMRNMIQGSVLEVLPQGGHGPHIRMPEDLSKVILHFLRKK